MFPAWREAAKLHLCGPGTQAAATSRDHPGCSRLICGRDGLGSGLLPLAGPPIKHTFSRYQPHVALLARENHQFIASLGAEEFYHQARLKRFVDIQRKNGRYQIRKNALRGFRDKFLEAHESAEGAGLTHDGAIQGIVFDNRPRYIGQALSRRDCHDAGAQKVARGLQMERNGAGFMTLNADKSSERVFDDHFDFHVQHQEFIFCHKRFDAL